MVPEVSPPPKTATPNVLQRIQEVIKQTNTPSWVDSVPRNFGESRAGTLKAAEWRILATIFLPLALISLWGEGTLHPSPALANEFRAILDHTMALISAVYLVCYRSVSHNRIAAYDDCISRYIRDLKTIHPFASHRSNHHMGMHVYDFLSLFGPVRSWWAFPFERIIGQLQRMPHNHKFGTSKLNIRGSSLFN
jgi:hypothetical protein